MSKSISSSVIQAKYEEISGSDNLLTLNDVLWLDNLVYFRTLQKYEKYIGYVLKQYFDEIGNGYAIKKDKLEEMKQAEFDAGYSRASLPFLTEEEINDVYKKLYNNERILNLEIVNTTSENGLTATCFMDLNSNLYVIYRGTDGPEAWVDNVKAFGEEASFLQKKAIEFFYDSKEKVKNFNKIIVSGHSKGGNMAKYVVIMSDNADICVSLDGQGFSKEFLEGNSYLVEKNKHKIIEVNAEYDYVSCLGNPVPYNTDNQVHYIKTDFQKNIIGFHYSNIIFDRNGNLRDFTYEKSEAAKLITDITIRLIDTIPSYYRKYVLNDFGSFLSGLIMGDTSIDLPEPLTLYFIKKAGLSDFFYRISDVIGDVAEDFEVEKKIDSLFNGLRLIDKFDRTGRLSEFIENIMPKYIDLGFIVGEFNSFVNKILKNSRM